MGVMSVRLNDETTAQLDALAKATGRTRSFLAGQAIEDYLARETWQIAEIEQAIKEADAGDFISSDEMNNLFKKLGTARHGERSRQGIFPYETTIGITIKNQEKTIKINQLKNKFNFSRAVFY